MPTMKEGDPAPDFQFRLEDGKETSLSEVAKKNTVVLYFYPRDFTPGCTKEACDFRDSWSVLQKANATVIGISTDSDSSHKKFKEKLKLPFLLIPDETKEIVRKYGVYGEKKFMGKTFTGTHRTTFIIGRDQKIKKIFHQVKVAGHVQEVVTGISPMFLEELTQS